MSEDLTVSRRLVIPERELEWRFSRSGGPGGQHSNKVSTRAELRWNVRESEAVSEGARAILLERLASRLDADGTLRVVDAETRSQRENRARARERMREILQAALAPRKRRRPTKPSRASKRRRLEAKRRHSEKKQRRRKDW